jgi:hypothetical protein
VASDLEKVAHRSAGACDRQIVARQLGRAPRAYRRVAVRCPFGKPAVTEQAPFDDTGAPFPTTFWLTCPYLVTQVSRLEAAGGVERWTRAARDNPALARSLLRADEEQRSLRPEHAGGIGGAAPGAGSLKCLHAHVAFALARPGYELGDAIIRELVPLWPSRCCTVPLP